MRVPGNDGTHTPIERVHISRVKKVLAVSLAVRLDKIRDTAEGTLSMK